MKLANKTKRLLAYVGIIGGCAVLAMTFFTISQFEKAKYQASLNTQLMCQNRLNKILDADKTALEDTNTSAFHDAAVMGTKQALHPVLSGRKEPGFLHYSSDSFTTSV